MPIILKDLIPFEKDQASGQNLKILEHQILICSGPAGPCEIGDHQEWKARASEG